MQSAPAPEPARLAVPLRRQLGDLRADVLESDAELGQRRPAAREIGHGESIMLDTGSTTAYVAGPSLRVSQSGTMDAARRMRGSTRMLIQKPRVRTFSRYSRAATSITLRASMRIVGAY